MHVCVQTIRCTTSNRIGCTGDPKCWWQYFAGWVSSFLVQPITFYSDVISHCISSHPAVIHFQACLARCKSPCISRRLPHPARHQSLQARQRNYFRPRPRPRLRRMVSLPALPVSRKFGALPSSGRSMLPRQRRCPKQTSLRLSALRSLSQLFLCKLWPATPPPHLKRRFSTPPSQHWCRVCIILEWKYAACSRSCLKTSLWLVLCGRCRQFDT